jgi:hypothetical protein
LSKLAPLQSPPWLDQLFQRTELAWKVLRQSHCLPFSLHSAGFQTSSRNSSRQHFAIPKKQACQLSALSRLSPVDQSLSLAMTPFLSRNVLDPMTPVVEPIHLSQAVHQNGRMPVLL